MNSSGPNWNLVVLVAASLTLTSCGGADDGSGTEHTPPPQHSTVLQTSRDGGSARLALTVDGQGGPVFLVGERVPLIFGNADENIATIDTSSCTVTSRWRNVDEFLDAAKANKVNLVHVELWSVWDPASPYPFLKDAAGKFRVQAAVESGQWNTDYFATVHNLVRKASDRGMVVFFALFNHYNIRIDTGPGRKPWYDDPFRAANTDTSFGLADGTDSRQRTATFLRFQDAAGNLTTVGRIQKAIVERLLEEVTERNVIFEPLMVPWVFNNPNLTRLSLPSWENWLIQVIRAKEAVLGRSSGVTISVTAAPLTPGGAVVGGNVYKDWDLVEWKNAFSQGQPGFEKWSQIDLVQYAGVLAFGDPPFADNSVVYMRERMLNHRRQFPELAMLYSTDGFNQRYAPDTCTARLGEYVKDVRHGWWDGIDQGIELSQYPLFWAQGTHNQLDGTPMGSIHFLNWTDAQSAMEDLSRGTY